MNDLWSRIQLVKVHFSMGSLSRQEFINILGHMFEEATKLRGEHHV